MDESKSPFIRDQARVRSNNLNVIDEYKSLGTKETLERSNRHDKKHHVLCCNINGDSNLGIICRTCLLFGCRNFHIMGRKKVDFRTMVGANKYLNYEYVNGILEVNAGNTNNANSNELDFRYNINKFCQFLEEKKLYPIFVEQGGLYIDEFDFKKMLVPKDYVPCFIFGNEGYGIPEELMATINDKLVLSIRQTPPLRSLNVSAAAAIILYKYYESSL